MAVYEDKVTLKDEVSKPAQAAGASMTQLASGILDAKNMIGSAMSGIYTAFAHLTAGNFAGLFRQIGSSAAQLALHLNSVVPGLGTLASTAITIATAGGAWVLDTGKKFLQWGIEMTEGRKRAIALFDALGQGEIAGKDVTKAIGDMADRTGMATSFFKPLAKELLIMGHRTVPDLKREMLAAASAQALMGEGGAGAYLSLAKRLAHAEEGTDQLKMSAKRLDSQLQEIGLSSSDMAKKMGLSLADFEKQLKAGKISASEWGSAIREAIITKGKGPLAEFGTSLEAIGNRFMRGFNKLFAQVDASPLLNRLNELVSGFVGTDAAAKGMGDALNGVFKFAAEAVEWLVIAFLDAAIWILGAIASVRDFFRETGEGKVIIDYLAASFEAFGVVVDVVAAGLEPIVWTLKQIGKAYEGLKEFFGGGPKAKPAAGKPLASMQSEMDTDMFRESEGLETGTTRGERARFDAEAKGIETGKAMSEGVAKGIAAGEIDVNAAAKKMSTGAVDTVKNTLQVKSPSRVMMGIGANVAEGYALGVEDGTGDVERAVGELARVTVEPGAGAPRASSGGGGSVTNHFSFTVQIDGAGATTTEMAEELVSVVFAKLALSQGLGGSP